MRTKSLGFALLSMLLFASCVSRMTVQPVQTGNEPGFRYYLPKTYLLVTPAIDGTVTVEKVFLPDPAHQYAVDSKAYLSKYKLSVQVDEKGLLKKVIWNADDAESTKAALESVANIQKARIDAEAAAAKAADEKAKKQADARATAEAAVAAAKLEVLQAEAALSILESTPGAPNADILAARITVEKAKLKLLAAQEALAKFDAMTASEISDTSALREPTNPVDLPDDKWPLRAWGPVLYEVVETIEEVDAQTAKVKVAKTVSLRPVNMQSYLPSSKKLIDPPEPVKVEVRIKGTGVLRKRGKPLRFVIESNTPFLGQIDERRIVLVRNGTLLSDDERRRLIHLNLSKNNDITVDLDADAPTGAYELTFSVQVLEGGKPKEANPNPGVSFQIK